MTCCCKHGEKCICLFINALVKCYLILKHTLGGGVKNLTLEGVPIFFALQNEFFKCKLLRHFFSSDICQGCCGWLVC